LARGESIATVLYTEPHCGSELAALTTRAEPDGDGVWRLYGRKIYNQKSQFGDYALCAARTTEAEVKFHGITLFMVPLRSAGVTIAPVWSMENNRFNEVILDGIRLTADDVVGRVDEAWHLIDKMLLLERTGIDFHGKVRRWFDLVLEQARETGRLADPVFGQRMADLDARLHAARALAWRQVANLAGGAPDPVSSAASKWFATEQARDVVRLAMELGELPATLSTWDPESPLAGQIEAAYRTAPTLTLASGTSEIIVVPHRLDRIGVVLLNGHRSSRRARGAVRRRPGGRAQTVGRAPYRRGCGRRRARSGGGLRPGTGVAGVGRAGRVGADDRGPVERRCRGVPIDGIRLVSQPVPRHRHGGGHARGIGPRPARPTAAHCRRTLHRGDRLAESGMAGPNEMPPMRIGSGARTVSATRRFVAFAGEVDYLLLVGRTAEGPCLGFVERGQSAVSSRRQDDISRGDFYAVSFVEAAVPEGGWLGGSPMWTSALVGARLLHGSYLVGSLGARWR
jgi:alkylation response protein AidB-like acyl-CoA dehydrogenase